MYYINKHEKNKKKTNIYLLIFIHVKYVNKFWICIKASMNGYLISALNFYKICNIAIKIHKNHNKEPRNIRNIKIV